jgi:hypothetical protein
MINWVNCQGIKSRRISLLKDLLARWIRQDALRNANDQSRIFPSRLKLGVISKRNSGATLIFT